MGAWDELDTELTVVNDISSLDELIDICNSEPEFADIFEPAIKTAEAYKEAIHDGSAEGLLITAERLGSRESRYATEKKYRAKNSRASGRLASSIQVEGSEFEYVVGTDIDEIYPLCVELGRGEVEPIPPKKRLRFYGKDGYLIYPLKVSSADPYPFVKPAFESVVKMIEKDGFGVFKSVCFKMDKVK